VAEITRKLGISEQTFYHWKRRYGGLGVAELRRLKQLDEENRKLKQLVADLSLDKMLRRRWSTGAEITIDIGHTVCWGTSRRRSFRPQLGLCRRVPAQLLPSLGLTLE
jgi:hypothetical protein